MYDPTNFPFMLLYSISGQGTYHYNTGPYSSPSEEMRTFYDMIQMMANQRKRSIWLYRFGLYPYSMTTERSVTIDNNVFSVDGASWAVSSSYLLCLGMPYSYPTPQQFTILMDLSDDSPSIPVTITPGAVGSMYYPIVKVVPTSPMLFMDSSLLLAIISLY